MPFSQTAAPLEPIVCRVGDPFALDVTVRVTSQLPQFLVLFNAPSYEAGGYTYPLMTAHVPHVESLGSAGDGDGDAVLYRVTLSLVPFPRTGFYDWQLVTVGSNGEPSVCVFADAESARLKAAAGARRHVPASNTSVEGRAGKLCQGRFIVHPKKLIAQHMHEVVVDLQVRRQGFMLLLAVSRISCVVCVEVLFYWSRWLRDCGLPLSACGQSV